MKLNLANTLTLARILTVPLVVALLLLESVSPRPAFTYGATLLFILASLTDLADGYIARRQHTITNLGKFLDPLADKLLISSVLIMLAELHWAAGWIVVVIVCRELAVTGMRGIAADLGVVIAADRYGKMKTISQIFALIPLMAHYPLFGIDLALIGEVLLYVALVLTIFSGANYLYNFHKRWLQAK